MENFAGRKIPPTCFYEFYTAEKLAKFLIDPTVTTPGPTIYPTPLCALPTSASTLRGPASILALAHANPEVRITQGNSFELLTHHSKALQKDSNFEKYKKMFTNSDIGGRFFCMAPEQLAKLDSTEQR